MPKEINQPEEINVTVKNVKEFASPDGGGFNCTVYLDGKKFCLAHEGGYGGCIDYNYLTMPKEGDKNLNIEIMRLNAIMKANPNKYGYEYAGMKLFKDFDWLVNEAVNQFHREKEVRTFKNKMKKRVLFVTPEDKKGSYRMSAILKEPSQFPIEKTSIAKDYKGAQFLDEGDNLEKFFARLRAKVKD